MNKYIRKLDHFLGDLKLAVILLLLFSIGMTAGTLFESYQGTDYANRMIYKTIPFFGIQFMMFISIVFAALHRFPMKKRLYGFYIVHLGLIFLGVGSFLTYYAGVDGQITLPPNSPSREIILDEDILKIKFNQENSFADYKLPYVAHETNIDKEYRGIKIKSFLPFAENKLEWKSSSLKNTPKDAHSGRYFLSNDRFSEEFTLSLHPEAIDFQSSLQLGPLSIHYLPKDLGSCFKKYPKAKLIFWNQFNGECFTPESINASIRQTNSDKRFIVFKEQDIVYTFFPDFSPWPMTADLKSINQKSPIRLFNKKLFEDAPHLFIFDNQIAYYSESDEMWNHQNLSKDKPSELPWMDFSLTLLENHENKRPVWTPYYTRPIQQNSNLIKGTIRAAEIEVQGKTFWVTNERPIQLLIDGKQVTIYLTKKTLTLPFEFVLTRFKMDKDPGTNSPASYESFIKLFTESGPQDHHVFMNNPLKHYGFTFYQASYSQDKKGNYISTLSANYDPGRFFKYLGSLMLFIGSILHFNLNYRKVKSNKPNKGIIA